MIGCFKRFSQSSNLSAHEKSHHIDREDSYSKQYSEQFDEKNVKYDTNISSGEVIPHVNNALNNLDEYCLPNKNDFFVKVISYEPVRACIKMKKENSKESVLTGVVTSACPIIKKKL